MKLKDLIKIQKLNGLEKEPKFTVTIGVFDGIHLGHSAIISELRSNALVNNYSSAVVTFDENYPKTFKNLSSFLLTYEEKKEFLSLKGVDFLVVLPFISEIKNLNPEEFISSLKETIPFSCICVGENFRFGRGREGDASQLIRLGEEFNFEVKVIPSESFEESFISSSKIRELISSGEIVKANKFLGYKYFLRGIVKKGSNIGSKLGFPTINVEVNNMKLIPKEGIYKGKVKVKDDIYDAAIYIGTRPTFNGRALRIEAYILDFSEIVYREKVELVFEEYIRESKKFDTEKELRDQIERDTKVINDKIKEEKLRKRIITIDGTAGSGKSTIAKLLAQRFGLYYIDSGALYRSVGWIANRFNLWEEEDLIKVLEKKPINFLWDGENFKVFFERTDISSEIRSLDAGINASRVGVMSRLREILTLWQRESLNYVENGIVLEGRDSGTIVFPQADMKLFISADIHIRAERRAKDLGESNIEKVIKSLKERDIKDINRSSDPLRIPKEAYFIDTTSITVEEAYSQILSIWLKCL
ncbi:MAG TPA: bifunctional riboflavin kinase/FAD synthetase [Dictyoglomaceae bacterium]|nr:bifunctional riboflavin kinase/FAD synthetase [Dictyoglomaceae bacterium]HPU42952.1 bifunctional riboflavin kinase/FAD synthetase [Dictyoglomaceae bacterium]